VASHAQPTEGTWDDLPFGALEVPAGYVAPSDKPKAPTAAPSQAPIVPPRLLPDTPAHGGGHGDAGGREPSKDWRRPENRRGSARRGGRRRHRQHGDGAAGGPAEAFDEQGSAAPDGSVAAAAAVEDAAPEGEPTAAELGAHTEGAPNPGGPGEQQWGGRGRRRRRRGRRGHGGGAGGNAGANVSGNGAVAPAAAEGAQRQHGQRPQRDGQRAFEGRDRHAAQTLTGMLVLDKGGYGVLRRIEAQFLPSKEDVWVPQHLVQRFKLREGSLITGPCGRGTQHKFQLNQVELVDGKPPHEVANLMAFKRLTSIDPDFHYAVGDITGDVSMRILDVICPVGRGSRGLIVAPPRSGKTILMRKFAQAIEQGYPDVHLMVLLVDERPEEATEWRRSTKGEVFVSTNDENTKNHVMLAEGVWKRAQRLVELGTDVVLLLDSITRLARAYNNLDGGSGRTMSGGLDSRAMEKPRSFFGSARNTETAGSLTILGTTLIETGSRLDQLVFEEFKGTGNMEIVLSRKLADRRIFPAIDIERSGTRKEEKLFGAQRLKRIQTLRRVLLKMNFVEAMELLITKLEDVEKTDDFLKRFDVDPEA
jgi:transcription termination factor Rho